ncbi:hypothetical protein FANTH_5283 [Fusarium anthophilum]|uniref:Uncharacterized protein n=1 Tax=Fusarium anthophilum TaxID=48485 RepID=A0A8H4ZMF4_9HYPO|nr:hypothetical protein FANTH_5283 [Fusarium anthophilum]
MKGISAKDPFFRFPSIVREKIITSLDLDVCYDRLCEASVVMNHERHTNKLTICSDSILSKFDHRHNYGWHVRLAHLRCRLSNGHLSKEDWRDYNSGDIYQLKLADPLISTRPEIVYEIDALHGRLGDYLSLGPEIVRAFVERHIDQDLAHYIVKAYGKYGERYPKVYPLTASEHGHVTAFLILVDMMDVLALSGPTDPTIFYSNQRLFSGGNTIAQWFVWWLAMEIQLKVQQEEDLRKWMGEESLEWQQSAEAVGMLEHGLDQAAEEKGEEDWVFV